MTCGSSSSVAREVTPERRACDVDALLKVFDVKAGELGPEKLYLSEPPAPTRVDESGCSDEIYVGLSKKRTILWKFSVKFSDERRKRKKKSFYGVLSYFLGSSNRFDRSDRFHRLSVRSFLQGVLQRMKVGHRKRTAFS